MKREVISTVAAASLLFVVIVMLSRSADTQTNSISDCKQPFGNPPCNANNNATFKVAGSQSGKSMAIIAHKPTNQSSSSRIEVGGHTISRDITIGGSKRNDPAKGRSYKTGAHDVVGGRQTDTAAGCCISSHNY